jgi:hypothetical protein
LFAGTLPLRREVISRGLSPIFELVSRLQLLLGEVVSGVFTPVLAKHTKHLSLIDVLSIGVDRIQRNFGPMKRQVEAWKEV